MTPIPISLQLYTVREALPQDTVGVLKKVAQFGYQAVEIGGFGGRTPEEYRRMLDDIGLKASSAWVETPSRDNISKLVDTYSPFGIKHWVGGFGRGDYATVDATTASAAKLQAGAEIATEHGFTFCFHNHEFEFEPLADGQRPYDIVLAKAPAVSSELDIYWAQFGGADPAQVVRQYRSRLGLVHVKDGVMAPDRSMTAVGAGKLDMPAILAEIDAKTTAWLIVELDACHTDMMEAVRLSAAYLIDSGYGAGRSGDLPPA